MSIGGWVDHDDFQVACEVTIAIEHAIGEVMIDTIKKMCTNQVQKNMAMVMATAVMIEKFDASKTAVGDGDFGAAVDKCLEMLRALPIEADGTRNLADLVETQQVH